MPNLTRTTPNGFSRPALAIVAGWFLLGLALLADAGVDQVLTPELQGADAASQSVVGAFLALGAMAVVASAFHWEAKSTAWRIELLAYPLLMAGWGLYGVSVILVDPARLAPVILAASSVAACLIRVLEVIGIIRRTRVNVDHLLVLPPPQKSA